MNRFVSLNHMKLACFLNSAVYTCCWVSMCAAGVYDCNHVRGGCRTVAGGVIDEFPSF